MATGAVPFFHEELDHLQSLPTVGRRQDVWLNSGKILRARELQCLYNFAFLKSVDEISLSLTDI